MAGQTPNIHGGTKLMENYYKADEARCKYCIEIIDPENSLEITLCITPLL